MVATNDPSQPQVALNCEGSVRAPLRLTVPSFQFGAVDLDDGPVSRTFKIFRGDGGPINPEVNATGHPNIKASICEVRAGEEYDLELEIAPPVPNGPIRSSLVLKTGVAESPQEIFAVSAQPQTRVSWSPNQFVLPTKLEKESSSTVQIQWRKDLRRDVLEAKVSDSNLTVRIEPAGVRQNVILTAPEGYTPSGQVDVVLRTNDEVRKEFTVPVIFSTPRPQRVRTSVAPATRNRPVRTVATGNADAPTKAEQDSAAP